jgi:hypothetical protein
MTKKSTSINFRYDDFLGPELSTLLALLNGRPADISKVTARAVPQAEIAIREKFVRGETTEHAPNWLLGAARYNPAFSTTASIGEVQDVLRMLGGAWVATGDEFKEKTKGIWVPTGVHDPKLRSIHENAEAFVKYGIWREQLKFEVHDGGAGWKDQLHLKPLSGVLMTPRLQAYEIMRQLLMSSDRERFHIAKCSSCEKFFWRESLSSAKRGLVHMTCRNRRSSKDVRKRQRKVLLAKRIARAADALRKMDLPQKGKPSAIRSVKEAIMHAMTVRMERGEDAVQLSWVSRNWAAIIDHAAKQEEKRR